MIHENPQAMKFTPEYLIGVLLKRYWLILIPLCLAVATGIVLSVKLPRIYEAVTLILVEPQRVPEDYVQSVIPTGIEGRISTISQQIMSRTNLEKVIEEFKLYSDPQTKDMFMEEKVADMRKRITVDVLNLGGKQREARGNRTDAFSIRFTGENPPQVMRVTNALATFFIDENLKSREASAIGTSNFLEDELTNIRGRLSELEAALKDYRQKYMGSLPEQLESNLRMLEGLRVQLTNRQQSLRSARDQLAMVERQMSEAEAVRKQFLAAEPGSPVAREATRADELKTMKADLEMMKTKYTDQHPDVIRLKSRIAQLEAEIAENRKEAAETQARPTIPPPEQVGKLPDFQRVYAVQYHALQKEIANLEFEIEKLKQSILEYETRVEETPKREQELMSLKRDYQNMNATYNSLLQRKLEAEIAVNMEKKQKGEQFRILDPARIPEKPISPNMRYLFLATIAAGLGIGAGLIFLLEYFDTSFKMPKQIESALGIPVMVTVPVIRERREILVRRVKNFFGCCATAFSLFLVALFYAVTQKGLDTTMAFIRRFIDI
ncbi:MAG: protein GumC [Deltaproteobacteria bacterium]|nr:protein GumC [Deltaproteobacteria bacterium]